MSLPEIPINRHVSQPITLSDQVKKLKKTLL
ncbi:hydrogenase, partial [Enterobacter hormaechei]|nr:hydrogenase [Enterobacter hormaechei]